MSASTTQPGPYDHRMIERLLFFSDAVIAIVVTLLVLELRPPEVHGIGELAAALQALTPKFVAFAGTFAIVIVFWAAHLAITRRLRVFDWAVIWVNALFLFAVATLPFASALIGEYGSVGAAWQVYCVALMAASFSQALLVLVSTRGGGRLVDGVTGREIVWRFLRAVSPGAAFTVGLVLSLQGSGQLAALCWTLIPPLLLVAGLFQPPKPKA